MDLLSAAKDFGLPLLGAVAGFITTSYAIRTDVKTLKKNYSSLKAGWKLEFETYKKETLLKQAKADEELEEKFAELEQALEELEKKFHAFERNSNSFASDLELTNFMQEQQRQWQTIQRTLGQIEGMMKRLP